LNALAERERPFESQVGRYFHLYRYNSELFLRSIYGIRSTNDQNWINRYTISDHLLEEAKRIGPSEMRWERHNLDALVRFAQEARERNIELRYIVTPYLPEHIMHVTNAAEWREMIERATGVPVWDYAMAIPQTSFFADRVHMNLQGGVAFARLLVRDGFFRPGALPPDRQPGLRDGDGAPAVGLSESP